jgi:peptidoglycan/LPS O-acetylase OafA/YrhL
LGNQQNGYSGDGWRRAGCLCRGYAMKSSTGAYYIGLDHLRALAALLVFEWHFIHAGDPTGSKILPYEYVPSFFPAAIIDEGHCGVALFMCLSGYLFGKLLAGKRINYWGFLWNRFIRLAPLFLLALVIVGLSQQHRHDLIEYSKNLLRSAIYPQHAQDMPNGGWSIVAEAYFYVALPLILLLLRRSIGYVVLIVVATILLRTGIYLYRGEVQSLAYWTIIGRADQFILGIVAFSLRDYMRSRHILMIALFTSFAAFYWHFDTMGGFYQSPSYPSPYPIWIVLPTIEAVFFSSLIAYYDSSFSFRDQGISALIAKIGTYSYSIYLTHFFYVFWMTSVFDSLFRTHNFYFLIVGGAACFLIAAVLASVSYRFIELPFLRLRRNYVIVANANKEMNLSLPWCMRNSSRDAAP